MSLKVVKMDDKRTDTQRELDESVKAVHVNIGAEIKGFILIAWPEDKNDAMTSYTAGNIDPDFIPEYARQRLIESQIDDMLEIGIDV